MSWLVFAVAATLAAATALGGSVPANPYGVCSHISLWDYEVRDDSCRWITAAGIGNARTDFLWRECQEEPNATFDFSKYDAVVASAENAGVRVLPILYGVPEWARPVYRHLDEWGAWIEALTRRYGSRLPEVEIWNEENLAQFWKETPNPADYLATLAAAHDAAKRGNPDVRVLFGGTSGVPLDFIEEIYRLGGARFFDAMNVHPYCHPSAPEGNLDAQIGKLKALMAKYGDADKPIVITEHGWPTHERHVDGAVLRTGLAVARPGKTSWNVVYAATALGADGRPEPALAAAIESALPPGSRLEACFGQKLRERLAQGDVDAVVYPFDEMFPADTFEAVFAYVKNGGVLVDCGGMPMWSAYIETAPGVFSKDDCIDTDQLRRRLRIDATASWMDANLPQKGRAFPTEIAKSAGYLGDPAGDWAARFQTPRYLKPGDEWIPLLTVEDKSGNQVVAASVVRFDSDMKGCVVVSGLMARGAAGTSDETDQARYLARSLAIAFAEGVDEYFWYSLRSTEEDPTYSEHHFGIIHANFTPKPGWGAYRNFILQRPAGSLQKSGTWHDDGRQLFYPQWTRPDGTQAGVIWKTGIMERIVCSFDSDNVRFNDYTGKTAVPLRVGEYVYAVLASESPLFFTGGHLTGVSR